MDIHNDIHYKTAIAPVSVSDNTAQVSQIIDRAGYQSVEFAILLGSLADADVTFVVLVEDGDAANLSDATAVDDAYLLGTELLAGFRFDDDNKVKKVGYIGGKRYVRMTITPSNNASAALLAAIALLGGGRSFPTSNPPA